MALMGCLARTASQEILVLQVGMGVKELQERWVSLVRWDLWGKKGYQEQKGNLGWPAPRVPLGHLEPEGGMATLGFQANQVTTPATKAKTVQWAPMVQRGRLVSKESLESLDLGDHLDILVKGMAIQRQLKSQTNQRNLCLVQSLNDRRNRRNPLSTCYQGSSATKPAKNCWTETTRSNAVLLCHLNDNPTQSSHRQFCQRRSPPPRRCSLP